MIQDQYLDTYEQGLTEHLLRMLSDMKLLNRQLLTSQDLSEKWNQMAPAYVADGVKEIAKYPTVSLGWAMYLGMAVANYWDKDWETYGSMPQLYEYIRDKRGFDYMDEYIRETVLELKGEEFDRMEQVVQDCAQQVLSKIRHEQIEPQSPMAFYVYARSIKVLFHMGAAVELKRMGYKMEKM
ncbi:MAG: hypothetical protein Q4D12_05415 [Bacteroidales bacterium]|nr:hypothetical protein [Bacteroidales bacterium]